MNGYVNGTHTCVCACTQTLLLSSVWLSVTPWTLASQTLLWNFPGKNTGAGCYFLLQWIFQTQELNSVSGISCIGRGVLYHWCFLGSPLLFFNATKNNLGISSVQFSSVAQWCPTLCDPMNHSTPGLPVHHQPPEFTQTHVHWVSDAIQTSHPLSSPPAAPNPSQHQNLFPMSQLFAWGGQSTGVSALASFLPKKSQGWSPLEWTGWISL